MYLNKDIDMCAMFMQSYINSVDMKMSVKNYLLKYLPYTYLYNGHLNSFTQYKDNYTFLLASSIDEIQDHSENNNYRKVNNQFEDNNNDNQDNRLKYLSINWNQSHTEVLDDISKEFKIAEECSSTITFYLTFPSYPENNSLINFFKSFQEKLNIPSSSFSFNDDKNLYYRRDIDPSFLSIIDVLPLSIFQELLRQHSNVRLVLCGHGLGGAIAQLSTLHVLSKVADLHYTQLRSISMGSLFFSKESTIDFIKDRHLEKHFINIYHQMDAIPSLFNVVELLSKTLFALEQEKEINSYGNIWSSIGSFFSQGGNQIETHRFYLKHLLSWLCHTLTAKYSTLSSSMCDVAAIDTTLDYLKKSLNYAKQWLQKDFSLKLIYQPIGIYNMITFQKFDETWHLINVINTAALNDHLNSTLERLSKSEQIFESHSISIYITDLQRCNIQKSESTEIQTLSDLVASFKSNEDENVDKTSLSYSNSDYSIIVPLPFRFSNDIYNQFRSGASYMSMIAVPPVYSSNTSTSSSSSLNDMKRIFLSAIKYRTGMSKLDLDNQQVIKKQKLSNAISIYDVCLTIYETYGMDARLELMKLQLDQRMLVPILVSNEKSLSSPFRSYIKTLSLVETPVLQSEENLLAQDSRLLRIGLVSTIQGKIGGLPDLIQNIFHTLSMRLPISGTGVGIKAKTVAEIGYGFLPDSTSPLSYQPVIVTHIIGDYRPLMSFLVQYVDALIIEHNEDDRNFASFENNDLPDSLRVRRIMKWKHTIDAEFDGIVQVEEPYEMDELEGSAKAVTSAFQKHLLDMSHSNSYLYSSNSPRPRLMDIIKDINLFIDDDTPMLDTELLFKDVNTAQLKKQDFQLQHSYKKEAESQLELDNPVLQLNDDRRKQLEEKIRRERKSRSKAYEKVVEIPLLKSYISLAGELNDEKRYIQKRQFEFTLSEYNEKTVSTLRKKKDETFSAMTQATENVLKTNENNTSFSSLKNKEKQAISKHYAAKQDFIDISTVIDHFWREISHVFVTNNTLYQTYPDLAAQHLIDGFSLELLDGDSMLLNIQWLEYVFRSLGEKLHKELNRPARILVLSICGPQSSGKSFLLKTMFGIRIRSSVGACTQGVNMMLVKVLYEVYDYILLLDTEGIRAPEFRSLPGADIRDNTLATFAVLPADGTILLNKGEINQALEDVLPTVLYLYASSSLSMQLGGQIPSKLFFVYNQIDLSQPQKGMEILQDLTTRLHNVTNKIREAMSLQNISFHGFEQCRLDLQNKSNSDFRILSFNTNNPPINHPVPLFGKESLQLRQWISQRITNISDTHPWQARSIYNILDYIKVIVSTIRQAHHITSVSTSLEMLANNKLNEQIESVKYNLSSYFTSIRTEIENDIVRNYTDSSGKFINSTLSSATIETITDQAYNMVLNRMQEIIMNAQKRIFELIKGTKREPSLGDDWKSFLEEKKIRNRKFLATKIDREITYSVFTSKVEEKIRQDFIHKCNKINCTNLTDKRQIEIFDEVLQNRIKEFQEPYQSGMVDVRHEIKTVYNRSIVIQNVKVFDDKEFCGENGTFQRISNEENELKHSESDQERFDRTHRSIQETQKFNEAIGEIKSIISILIDNHQRYESFIVNEVLQRIDQIIKKHSLISLETIQDIHRGTFCFLDHKLIQLQNLWDSKHNRTKRLEENQENLWIFFQNVAEGIRGIKLFQLELYNQLKSSWQAGFIEVLIRDVKTEVAKKPWISNSDILSAFIDNEKIQILESDEKNGIYKLLDEINSKDSFYEKCLNKFVQVYVNRYARTKWKKFYENLIDAIKKAGDEAKNSPKDCLNVFLQTLRSETLPFSIRSRLPNTAETYGNVDDQPRNIFDDVVKKLISAPPEKPSFLLKGNESKEILDQIRQDAPNNDAKPRCSHTCRVCGAQCFEHSNHSGHHNFHHQPAGLAGTSILGSDLIVHTTCHEELQKDGRFTLDKGLSFHPYTEFPKIFGYEAPYAQGRRSKLGEFLMSKYHNEIASYYRIKPNPPVPIAFTVHTLDSIKAEINNLMQLNT